MLQKWLMNLECSFLYLCNNYRQDLESNKLTGIKVPISSITVKNMYLNNFKSVNLERCTLLGFQGKIESCLPCTYTQITTTNYSTCKMV